jgi:hypothetical protein
MDSDSFLFIPDISGFTEFVNETEISHSAHVISELLEVIIESDGLGMTVSEIEGDAVVFFLRNRTPDLREIIGQAQTTFQAFHSQLKRYERDRICPCGACRTAHRLSLKMVAHGGPIETIKVQDFEKPYGADVILAHRLLKNDVDENEYLLLTEVLKAEGEGLPPWAKLIPGATTYDTLGEVKYHHVPLGALRANVPEPPPPARPAKPNLQITQEVHIPLPLGETFEMVSNFDQRLLWNRGVDELVYDQDRVNRVGTRHQCVIDGSFIDFETVTSNLGPDKLVYGERILSKAPVDEPTLYYILQEESGGTRVRAEVHYQPKPFPKSILAVFFRLAFARRLPKTLAAMAEVGMARAGNHIGIGATNAAA